jgi:general secretion pathway protein D
VSEFLYRVSFIYGVHDVSQRLSLFIVSLLIALLAGCSDVGGPRRDGIDAELAPNKSQTVPVIPPRTTSSEDKPITLKQDDKTRPKTKPEMEPGSGLFYNPTAASAPVRNTPPAEGQTSLNFENVPIQAVVQQILGALLQETYSISPTVTGNVTFSTAKPITTEQAMPILEMLLAWTNNTLIHKNGRYEVVPTKEAIPGNLAPRIAPPRMAQGYEVRVFPLKYISATEMQKLLKPYAKADAIVAADNARSMVVMAGTASELENYQRTIEVFDVDWLKGMSVGVYGLRNMDVTKIMPELDKIFGATGESPLAGMFRFIPMESTNSIVVITPQRDYLDQAEKWLYRLDMGVGENGTQLYVYDVKNVKAVDLSDHLNAIFTGKVSSAKPSNAGNVAPGLKPASIGGLNSSALGSSSSMQPMQKTNTTTGANGSSNLSTTGAGAPNGANAAKDSDIRITPIEENNQLLVMATPGEWDGILAAIRRLDISPLQVQIEAKVLEVQLTGDLEFGVEWWLAGLKNNSVGSSNSGTGYTYGPNFQGNTADRHRTLLGSTSAIPQSYGDTPASFFYSFLNKNMQVAINALQSNGTTKILSSPSMVVMNNQEAQINVGQQVPVLQTSIVGISNLGTTDTSGTNNVSNTGIGSVSYISTGVQLDVKPRVNPGGLVYMDVTQQVSSPGATTSVNGNPPINQRQLQTQVAVQSGETVLLGGLIEESDTLTKSGIPFLNDVPILGRLFGSTSNKRDRTEIIVLITPRVISSVEDARVMTDEYRNKFESLAPLRNAAAPGAPAPTPLPAPLPNQPVDVRPQQKQP